MKKLISILSAVSVWALCYCAFACGSVAAQTTIGFSIAGANVTEKDTFNIVFKADSVLTGKNIYAFRFGLSYNADYLECLGISASGTMLSSWGLPSFNKNSSGTIMIAGAGTTPLSGSGNMFQLKFRAIKGGGTYIDNIASLSYLNEGAPALNITRSFINCTSLSLPDIYPDSYSLYVGDELQMNVNGGTGPYIYRTEDTAVAVITANTKVKAKKPGVTRVYVTDSKGLVSYTSGVIDVRAIKLRVMHSTVWPGENFLVPIRLEIAPGTKVYAGSFDLSFSGNIEGITASAVQGDFTVSVQNKAYPGLMHVSFASSTALTGSGLLCYLGFKAINSGMQYVNLGNALFNESLFAFTYNENAEVYSLPNLNISPNTGNMMWGNTQKITVTNGTPPITYASSDTSIATIDALGNLYGKTGGKIQVKVTDSHGATKTSGDFLFYHNQFSVTNTDGQLDKDTRVPVVTSPMPPGKAIYSFNGFITYDTNYLRFVRLDPINSGMLVQAVNTNNTITVVGAASSGITNGNVCFVVFRLKNTLALNQQTNVNLSSFVANEGEFFSTLLSGKVTRVTQVSYRPVAVAGSNFSVNESVTVTLDGSGSYDNDNNPLTYSWTSPKGIKLDDSTAIKPTFTAPVVKSNTNFTFTLVVNDGTSNSDPSSVTVTVIHVNRPPVANAGPDRSYTEGSTVSLDGGSSYDPDGEAISYQWTALDGIVLFDAKSPAPSFIAPQVNKDTRYRFKLVVSDGVAFSPPDTVVITSLQVNRKPVAFAGGDQTVNEGTMVYLDGSSSSDPDGDPITYLWTAPSNVVLSSRTVPKPTFTAPPVHRDSTIAITLVVNDGSLNSDVSKTIITIKNVDILSQEAKIKKGALVASDSVAVNALTNTVTLYLPYGTDVSNLAPTFTLSDKATLSPPGGTPRNFSTPLTYTVTAEDGLTQAIYQVKVFVPDVTLSRTLSAGWNWISLSVDPANAALTSVFAGLTFSNLDYLKSSTASAVYYSGSGWFGDLMAVPQYEMLKCRKASAQKFTFSGKQINPSQAFIPVAAGWNRIAYLLKGNTPVNSSFDKATLPAGSIVLKSKEASAVYYPVAGWVGDLDSMRVLNGYMMKTESAGNIRYSAAAVKLKALETPARLFNLEDLYSAYNIHPADFENSATLIGEFVNQNGESITQKGDLLIAYINGEARGVTEAVFISDINSYVFFLTIFSNSKDNISLKLKPSADPTAVSVSETFSFNADEVFGTPLQPMQLHSVVTGIASPAKSRVITYPNPVTDELHIVSESVMRNIFVYDAMGNAVRVVAGPAGKSKRLDTRNLAPGVYTLKIETPDGAEFKKFVKSAE